MNRARACGARGPAMIAQYAQGLLPRREGSCTSAPVDRRGATGYSDPEQNRRRPRRGAGSCRMRRVRAARTRGNQDGRSGPARAAAVSRYASGGTTAAGAPSGCGAPTWPICWPTARARQLGTTSAARAESGCSRAAAATVENRGRLRSPRRMGAEVYGPRADASLAPTAAEPDHSPNSGGLRSPPLPSPETLNPAAAP